VRDLDVAHGGEGGQQVEALKDEANALLAQAGAGSVIEGGKIVAVDDDPAGGGAGKSSEQVEQRLFS
jgi:hypothetical protein